MIMFIGLVFVSVTLIGLGLAALALIICRKVEVVLRAFGFDFLLKASK